MHAWDPVGAPAPSAQVTPASSPYKSHRSQPSPISPSASLTASTQRDGYTPVSSRAARRREGRQLQRQLATPTQANSATACTVQDDGCESLPSQLGFVSAAPVDNLDSPAHMLPGPEPCTERMTEPVEAELVWLLLTWNDATLRVGYLLLISLFSTEGKL